MPRYAFTLELAGERRDIRWSYLPSDETAQTYARVLIRNVRLERIHPRDPNLRMVVSDGDGKIVATLPVFSE